MSKFEQALHASGDLQDTVASLCAPPPRIVCALHLQCANSTRSNAYLSCMAQKPYSMLTRHHAFHLLLGSVLQLSEGMFWWPRLKYQPEEDPLGCNGVAVMLAGQS